MASDETRGGPRGPVAEGEGETLGEAKWGAMKELERRFPGLSADCVAFAVLEEPDGATARPRERRGRRGQPGRRWRTCCRTSRPSACGPWSPGSSRRSGLHATVDIEETDDEIRATVNGDDLGLLIGKHGATIDALQHIAFRAASQGLEDRKPVTVDAAGYRERREAALQRIADRAAAEALRFERPVELEPMRPGERKIVHTLPARAHGRGDAQRGRRARAAAGRDAAPRCPAAR